MSVPRNVLDAVGTKIFKYEVPGLGKPVGRQTPDMCNNAGESAVGATRHST